MHIAEGRSVRQRQTTRQQHNVLGCPEGQSECVGPEAARAGNDHGLGDDESGAHSGRSG